MLRESDRVLSFEYQCTGQDTECRLFYTFEDGDFTFTLTKVINPFIFMLRKEALNVNIG
jgi:hypothetical protein